MRDYDTSTLPSSPASPASPGVHWSSPSVHLQSFECNQLKAKAIFDVVPSQTPSASFAAPRHDLISASCSSHSSKTASLHRAHVHELQLNAQMVVSRVRHNTSFSTCNYAISICNNLYKMMKLYIIFVVTTGFLLYKLLSVFFTVFPSIIARS